MTLFRGAATEDSSQRPLDASLASIKEDAKSQLRELKFACDELWETISILKEAVQDSQQRLKSPEQWAALEDSVVSQGIVIKAQVAQIEEMWKRAFSAGMSKDILTYTTPDAIQRKAELSPKSNLCHISPHHDRPKWVSLSPSLGMSHGKKDTLQTSVRLSTASSGGQGIIQEILGRCLSRDQGIRCTTVSSGEARKTVKSLPKLDPIVLPSIPSPKIASKEESSQRNAGVKSTSQPPLPSFSLQEKSKGLMDKAGTAATKPTSQPPLPSFSLQEKSKGLMDKAGASQSSAFNGSSSSAFGQTSIAPAVASPGFGQSTGFGGSSSSAFGQTSIAPAVASPGFGQSTGFGGSSSSAFGQTSSAPAAASPGFGQSTGFGGSSSSAFGQTSSAPAVASPGFGQSTGFGGSSSSAFGQTSSAPAAASPGFGQSTGFGGSSSSAFGQTPSAPAAASPGFGQSTGFGGSASFGTAPSAFGQTPTVSGPSSGFGAFQNTPSSTFGALANNSGAGGFASFADSAG